MFFDVAAANVARKYSPEGGVSCSAWNHEPRATSTPFAMQLLKISSSMSSMLLVEAFGWTLWLTFSQCYPIVSAGLTLGKVKSKHK